MPFKSRSQQKFLYARHPAIAERWAKETPDIKNLPEKKRSAAAEVHKLRGKK